MVNCNCSNKTLILNWLNNCDFYFSKVRTINNEEYTINITSKVIEFEEDEVDTRSFSFHINEYYFAKANIKTLPDKFDDLSHVIWKYRFKVNIDIYEDLSDFGAEIIHETRY